MGFPILWGVQGWTGHVPEQANLISPTSGWTEGSPEVHLSLNYSSVLCVTSSPFYSSYLSSPPHLAHILPNAADLAVGWVCSPLLPSHTQAVVFSIPIMLSHLMSFKANFLALLPGDFLVPSPWKINAGSLGWKVYGTLSWVGTLEFNWPEKELAQPCHQMVVYMVMIH